MAASITFTDGIGAVTLTNGKPGPGSRFAQWVPDIARMGDSKVGLGTGITYEYLFRQDYTASFTMELLPLTALPLVARFKAWALGGNTFTVNTDDVSAHSYLCRLKPSSTLDVSQSDRVLLEYKLVVNVISADSPPVFLDCRYRS